jgi:type IV pilus assembly protein PilF
MRKLVILAVLALAACAGQQTRNSGEESQARESARIHTELGAGYYAQNRMAIALEEFTTATKSDPSYAMAYNGLGLVYGALGEDSKAEASFKKSLALEPGNSQTHNNYGSFLCSRNRIEESITQFLEAVKNPLYVTPGVAYMNAGTCALRMQDVNNAEIYLQKALQAQPLLYQASYQLALIHFERGQNNLARNYLQNALQGEPTAEMLWLAIRVARLQSDKDAEASYALELRRKFPNSDETKALLSGR